jgi:hypothetical protein
MDAIELADTLERRRRRQWNANTGSYADACTYADSNARRVLCGVVGNPGLCVGRQLRHV